MTVKLKNNVVGYLATAISASDTGIVLQSGNGAGFPSLSTGEYFYATLVSSGGTLEVVKVTARVGDTMTVVRAQDGSSAAGFTAGSRVEMRVNAKSVLDLVDSVTAGTVPFTPAGGISSTNVQDAIEEVDAAFSSITAATVSFTPTGTVTATNVQDAIVQASAGGTAASVSFTPAQGIAATNVQAALEEVKTDLSASSGTTTIGYTRGGVGAVTRTLQQHLSDNWISVKDFGAVGDYVADDTAAIQAAINSTNGNTIYFPPGTYKISAPINIKRGIRLRGCGPFDDSNNNSIIRLANGANCTMVQTPAAVGGSATHFMAIEDIGFHGNGLNQTVEQVAIKFYGAWVGSWIRNIAIYEAYGTALEFENGSDVQVDHVWILGTISPSGKYALSINPSDTIKGLMNFNHLYVEWCMNKKNGNPFLNENDRGNGIRVSNVVSCHMQEVRVEATRRPIDLVAGLEVRLDHLHAIAIGHSADADTCFVRHVGSSPSICYIGTLFVEQSQVPLTIRPIRKSTGMNNPFVPEQLTSLSYSGQYISTQDFGPGTTTTSDWKWLKQMPTLFTNGVGIESVDNWNPLYFKFFNGSNGDYQTRYAFLKDENNTFSIGSTYDQPSNAERTFLKFFSYGSNYDHVEFPTGPIHLAGTRASAQDIPDGSLWQSTSAYEGGAGLVWQRIFGNNGGGDMVVSARRGAGVPAVNAGFIGQMWIDVTASPRQAYIAVNVGTGPTDWRLIT